MDPMGTGDDLAEVIRLERSLLDPVIRRDPVQVLRLLHEDFLEFGASGRMWNRHQIAAALAEDPEVAGQPVDVEGDELADGVVLVTYRLEGPSPSLRSSIWLRGPSVQWTLRLHQGTKVPRTR
jgi:hypothetical protein